MDTTLPNRAARRARVSDERRERRRIRKLQTRTVAARYNVSTRTVDRWTADPRVGFPQPSRIYHRKYWDEDDLDAFDARKKPASSNDTA
jgi:hypothetical protein